MATQKFETTSEDLSDRKPQPALGPLLLVWAVLLVVGYFVWPEMYHGAARFCEQVFWMIVPRHVRP